MTRPERRPDTGPGAEPDACVGERPRLQLVAEPARRPVIMSTREALAPVLTEWEWQVDAACREADSELFFHPPGERGEAKLTRERAAKAYCRRCPVAAECFEFAFETAQPYGVWGGMSEDERDTELRRQGRRRLDR